MSLWQTHALMFSYTPRRYMDNNLFTRLPYLVLSYDIDTLQHVWLTNNPQLQCYPPAPSGVAVHVAERVRMCDPPPVVRKPPSLFVLNLGSNSH